MRHVRPILDTSLPHQFTGLLSSLKTYGNRYHNLGFHTCWFEEPSLGSKLSQANQGLVNMTDVLALSTIPSTLIFAQNEISELHTQIDASSVVPSTKILLHLFDYLIMSRLIERRLRDFIINLEVTLLRAFSTTQLTIDGLEHIFEIEKNQSYPAWAMTCVREGMFGAKDQMEESSNCSTSLSASQFAEHIDEIIPQIQSREEDASMLIQTFGRLHGYLMGADEARKRNKFQTVMQFYEKDEVVEATFWTKIHTFFKGEQTPTDLEVLKSDIVQQMIPFTQCAASYFKNILAELKALHADLAQLRTVVEQHKNWSFGCGFAKPPLRTWIKQLKLSIPLYPPRAVLPRERRKIDMPRESVSLK